MLSTSRNTENDIANKQVQNVSASEDNKQKSFIGTIASNKAQTISQG